MAGAESYLLNLIKGMSSVDGVNCTCAMFYSGELKEKLFDESINVVELFGKKNIKSIIKLRKYINENNIEIVHFVDLKSTIVGFFSSIFNRKIKTVSTVHGLPEKYKNFKRQVKYLVSISLYFFLLRFLIDRVICVSEDLNRKLQKWVGKKKCITIHNGIFIEKNNLSSNNKSPSNKIIVGTVGRLVDVKGHVYLLETAKEILKKRDDVFFQIVGAGPLENFLKEKANSLGVSAHVDFLGFRSDAKSLISDMDIFILPSLHEGIPYVLLEAMSLSKPVICSDVGGIKEVIQNKIDGILVPSRDFHGLCDAILNLLQDPQFSENIANNGFKKIEQKFSSEVMSHKTFGLYSELTLSFAGEM